jgi:crossover junction endodeoxyribonuclease RuvC
MARYPAKAWRTFEPAAVDALARGTAVGRATPAALPGAARLPLAHALPRSERCRILGLDPGSRRTGFAVIDCLRDSAGQRYATIEHGRIEVAHLELAERMHRIHEAVRSLLLRHAPDEVAIERVFVSRNVESALKLGQARGAALAALGPGAHLAEYAPREIKLAAVGHGAADKRQVAHMVVSLLAPVGQVTPDAADALAVALCHANTRRLRQLAALVQGGADCG